MTGSAVEYVVRKGPARWHRKERTRSWHVVEQRRGTRWRRIRARCDTCQWAFKIATLLNQQLQEGK